jgi:25S rRNA (cytosine2278-C5)-methyltransferase
LPPPPTVPRYIRINTLKIKRSEVHEYLQNEGWCLVPREPDETYDQFLEKIRKLDDDHYLIDFHVDDILVFPSSSRRVWAHNELVRDWQLILQDKASCLPPFLLNPPKGAQVRAKFPPGFLSFSKFCFLRCSTCAQRPA